jgi:hypothetical protein
MSEATVLFRARHLGEPVTTMLATEADMSRLAASVACASEMLECWSLISVRSPSEIVVHAHRLSAPSTVDHDRTQQSKFALDRHNLRANQRFLEAPEYTGSREASDSVCGCSAAGVRHQS